MRKWRRASWWDEGLQDAAIVPVPIPIRPLLITALSAIDPPTTSSLPWRARLKETDCCRPLPFLPFAPPAFFIISPGPAARRCEEAPTQCEPASGASLDCGRAVAARGLSLLLALWPFAFGGPACCLLQAAPWLPALGLLRVLKQVGEDPEDPTGTSCREADSPVDPG